MNELMSFSATLSSIEKATLKEILCNRIVSYFNDKNELSNLSQEKISSFNALSHAIRELTPYSSDIPQNGISFYGHPTWLTDDLLDTLQREAQERKNKKLDRVDHFLSCGGEVADKLSVNKDIIKFMSEHVGNIKPTGIASYLYYDFQGGGIKPHVDTEVFYINLIIMLKHDAPYDGVEPSSTIIFPPGMPSEKYQLKVGEVILMHGSSTIHTRSIISNGEDIHLLTIGFQKTPNN